MSETQTKNQLPEISLELDDETRVELPRPLTVISPEHIKEDKVAAKPKVSSEDKAKINEKVEQYWQMLNASNPGAPEFTEKLELAFSAGRREIAQAATLTTSFSKENFRRDYNSPAFSAINELRNVFEDLNPGDVKQLVTPRKFLGMPLPWGDKLSAYLRRYESAESQIGKLQEMVIESKQKVADGVDELGTVREQLWVSMEKIEKAIEFMKALDEKVSKEVEIMKQVDKVKADVIAEEVLVNIRQTIGDLMSTQAMTMNSYMTATVLRKTGKEVIRGCDRAATLGMAALSQAVVMAKAINDQQKTQEGLMKFKESIENLVEKNGQMLNQHVENTVNFAQNPLLGLETIKNMFDQSFKAMDAMDQYRLKSLEVLKSNNELLGAEIDKNMKRMRVSNSAAPKVDLINDDLLNLDGPKPAKM